MNKPVFGLLLGGVLGIFDGLSAWFYPEVRTQIMGIVIGSTFKGLITGVCIGYFAKKVNRSVWEFSLDWRWGCFLAFLVAAMPNPAGKHYNFEIMLPGSILGAVVGFATQRYKGGYATARAPS